MAVNMFSEVNTDYFLSCDWGTSSFRLRLADRRSGDIRESVSTANGIQKVFDSWKAAGKPERETFYLRHLKEGISLLTEKVKRKLDGIPVVLSGMASSSIGIKELPYTSLPVSVSDPDLNVEILENSGDFLHSALLISGLCTRSDVMRGEETQLLGLAAVRNLEEGTCILPGTHSKHIFLEEGQITGFSTYMTGELFHLLSTRSILKDTLSPESSLNYTAFEKGIRDADNNNLLNSLFSIRANSLLHYSDPVENRSYLSGLLIGTELAEIQNFQSRPVILAGESQLCRLYSEALKVLNLSHDTFVNPGSLATEGHRFMLSKTGI